MDTAQARQLWKDRLTASLSHLRSALPRTHYEAVFPYKEGVSVCVGAPGQGHGLELEVVGRVPPLVERGVEGRVHPPAG